jgi:DNA-directed RNA polymerase subunit M/transcription elongation factor TFIIS
MRGEPKIIKRGSFGPSKCPKCSNDKFHTAFIGGLRGEKGGRIRRQYTCEKCGHVWE